jgi:hypothetical protein
MNRFPENRTPASPWLKRRLFDAADTCVRTNGALLTGPRGGRVRQYLALLRESQLPSFIFNRLPDPEGVPLVTDYIFNVAHHHRRDIPLGTSYFAGRITLERDCVYAPGRHETVRVTYLADSRRNHLVRRIMGGIQERHQGRPSDQQYPLPGVAARFPKRVAATEAWQLVTLLDPPPEVPADLSSIGIAVLGELPPAPPPSGGGSYGN